MEKSEEQRSRKREKGFKKLLWTSLQGRIVSDELEMNWWIKFSKQSSCALSLNTSSISLHFLMCRSHLSSTPQNLHFHRCSISTFTDACSLGRRGAGAYGPILQEQFRDRKGPIQGYTAQQNTFLERQSAPQPGRELLGGKKKDISCMFHKPASFGFIN